MDKLAPKTDEIVAFLSYANPKILEEFKKDYPNHPDIFKPGEIAGTSKIVIERLEIKSKLCIATMQEAIKQLNAIRPKILDNIKSSNRLILITQIITIISSSTLLGLVIANARTFAIVVSLLSLASSIIATIVEHNNKTQFLNAKKSIFIHYDELLSYKSESEYILNELKFYTEAKILEEEIDVVSRLINKGNRLSIDIKKILEKSLISLV